MDSGLIIDNENNGAFRFHNGSACYSDSFKLYASGYKLGGSGLIGAFAINYGYFFKRHRNSEMYVFCSSVF